MSVNHLDYYAAKVAYAKYQFTKANPENTQDDLDKAGKNYERWIAVYPPPADEVDSAAKLIDHASGELDTLWTKQKYLEILNRTLAEKYLPDRKGIAAAARRAWIAASRLGITFREPPDTLSFGEGHRWFEDLISAAEKFKAIGGAAPANKPEPEPADPVAVDDESLLAPARLAALFGVPLSPLQSRLKRWRKGNPGGWIENPDRTSREAQYLYRVGSVRPVLAAMVARPAKRPANDRRKKS